MTPDDLQPMIETAWVWVAAPALLIAALIASFRLRLPQLTGFAAAFRGLKGVDAGAEGSVHPATSAGLAAVATYGAAGAVGAATAVSLGGAGAIAWVWLFTLVVMPLRMAEALLARTAPAGKAGAATGSLASRLLADDSGLAKALGWATLALVPLAGFTFFGGAHGGAVTDAAEQLLPGSALPLGLGVALIAAFVAVLPLRKSGAVLGWTAAVALVALSLAGLAALFGDPGSGFSSFGRAFMDAMYDAPNSAAFSGALAGEIATAALLHILPPLAAAGGVDGALHAEAQAKTTRGHAATALLGPLSYGVIVTVVGLSLVSTGAFSRPVEDERRLEELTFYRVGFESVSQRREVDRRFTGFVRVREGGTGVVEVHLGTQRGMVRAPSFDNAGEPADVALHVRSGHVDDLQRPGRMGALETRPIEELRDLVVKGRMLPRGGKLLATGMTRGAGSMLSRVALAALLLLALIGAVGWGVAVSRTLAARVPAQIARAAAVLPALGIGLAALGVADGLGAVGALVAAALVVVTSLGIALRAKAAGEIARPAGR